MGLEQLVSSIIELKCPYSYGSRCATDDAPRGTKDVPLLLLNSGSRMRAQRRIQIRMDVVTVTTRMCPPEPSRTGGKLIVRAEPDEQPPMILPWPPPVVLHRHQGEERPYDWFVRK